MTDGGIITAAGVFPVEFAKEVFQILDLFTAEVLDAWAGLFKKGESQYVYKLMELVAPK